ncbi:MAG TPA: hypothetical protein VLZ74_02850 [Methylocella sp.]|nr:hypothetical protein [Methylocella sp.]
MTSPDLEIIVSWNLDDYEMTEDGGEGRALLAQITAEDDLRQVKEGRGKLFVPYPMREWQFHKNDADTWPSPLHGHHSAEPIKIDAIDGSLWHIKTKKRVGKVKLKELDRIQWDLLNSKDFVDKATTLFGPARVKALREGVGQP